MRRTLPSLLSLLVALSLLLSACAPNTAATEAVAEATATTAVEEPAAEPTATTAAETAETGGDVMLPEVVPGDVTGPIVTAGSSTVYPLADAVANLFRDEGFADEITIDSIGSGAGIERFCVAGETDIANASRGIKDSEIEACQAIGRDPIEIRVGTDAIVVAVHPDNDFLNSLTLEELATIFSDKATNWSDVNPEWPAEPINRYTPGTDSGTHSFFIETVLQPAYEDDADTAIAAFQNAANLQQSEDDNVLVQGIEGDQYAIGFFGFAYYQENEGALKAVSVEGVEPNAETAESGDYPLSRPLFLYTDATILQEKPQVAAYVNFFLTRVNELILDVGYFPASDEALNEARQALLDATR